MTSRRVLKIGRQRRFDPRKVDRAIAVARQSTNDYVPTDAQLSVSEGGTPVVAAVTDVNFDGEDFDVTDDGDDTATVERHHEGIRRHQETDQTLAAGATTVIEFDTEDFSVGGITYSAGEFTAALDGIYRISSQIHVETPSVGVISGVLFELQVDGGVGYVTLAQDTVASGLNTDSDVALTATTNWMVSSGDKFRVRLTYSSTLGGVVSLLFPTASTPINHFSMEKA